MKRKLLVYILILVLLCLSVAPVMAHADEEHPPTDLERVITGAGLILISVSLAALFLTRGKAIEEPKRKTIPSQTGTSEREG